jgi:hypothetical protein
MWRNKKLVIASVLVVGILVLSISGVALAQAEGESSGNSLFARVAAILGIDEQKVESAFNQAQSEMQKEAMAARLKSLVEQGRLTQEQADQYQQWWESKPDVPDIPGVPGMPGGRGFRGLPPESGAEPTAAPQAIQ